MEKPGKMITRQEIIQFIRSHKQQLRDTYGVTRIGLFGSYARDEAKEGSDIDLTVEIQSSNKYRSFFGLKSLGELPSLSEIDDLIPEGIGEEVLISIKRLEVGRGFQAGFAVVFLAIVFDRIMQGISTSFEGGESVNE